MIYFSRTKIINKLITKQVKHSNYRLRQALRVPGG
jgi:hypothetical protein